MPFPAPGWTIRSGREMGDYIEDYAADVRAPGQEWHAGGAPVQAGDGSDELIAIAGDRRFGLAT